MLKKLIKYNFKEISRTVIPFLIIFVVFQLFFSMSSKIWLDFFNTGELYGVLYVFVFLIPIYLLSILAMFFSAFFSCTAVFNRNLFGNQGYLMRTLPVKPIQHIVSLLLVSFFWLIVSYSCVLIMHYLPPFSVVNTDSDSLKTVFSDLIGSGASEIVGNVVSLIANFFYYQLLFMTAIVISSKHFSRKFLAMAMLTVIANMVMSTISGIIAAILISIDNDSNIIRSTILATEDSAYDYIDYITPCLQFIFAVGFFVYVVRQLDGRSDLQ